MTSDEPPPYDFVKSTSTSPYSRHQSNRKKSQSDVVGSSSHPVFSDQKKNPKRVSIASHLPPGYNSLICKNTEDEIQILYSCQYHRYVEVRFVWCHCYIFFCIKRWSWNHANHWRMLQDWGKCRGDFQPKPGEPSVCLSLSLILLPFSFVFLLSLSNNLSLNELLWKLCYMFLP